MSLIDLLIGRRVANREAAHHRIGVLAGIPAMGLDGLSSAAYGPEAALAVLAASGAAGLGAIRPITAAILILLAILWSSYWQTIAAYPNNGGSYVVAKDNLGTNASLLAAAALMIDYTLTVAVGISAGVAALTSAVPALHAWSLLLCLAVLALLTLANLRGTRESGLAWAVPTYGYLLCLGAVLFWGSIATAGGNAHPVVSLPAPPQTTATLSVWLILRAFSSGCTAMTGVEAVSNGVSAFREPTVRRAHLTLSSIVVVLGLLLFGVAHLAKAYGVTAMDQNQPGYQTVLSQLTAATFGRSWFYYVTIICVLSVLCLSANTSFVGFPRLCHMVAQDRFLPRAFVSAGRRLVYSVGILFLAGGSGALLVAFGGITDRLIPLYAVGAFLSFTLSQAGMAVHWRHATNERGARIKLLVNGTGAIATGAALAIMLVAKFTEGAWLTVIIIPCALALLRLVRRYYDDLDAQLLAGANRRLDLQENDKPFALVPIGRWDRVAAKGITYAMRLAEDVTALHVTTVEGPERDDMQQAMEREWAKCVAAPARKAGLRPPQLRFVESQYRSVVAPVLREIEAARRHSPHRPVFIVLPEIVEGNWWGYLLHTHRERRMRARLLRFGGPNMAVIGVPWQLGRSDPREGLAEEEPAPETQREPQPARSNSAERRLA